MKKPIIGVLPLVDNEKESYWMLPGYMKGIQDAGGIPVMLPLSTDKEVLSALANTFDGFLFTGGQDLNPELYGEKVEDVCGEQCEERDTMERILFQHVLDLDKPALGICRGLQLFNVLLGGTLYQDMPSQRKTDYHVQHKQEPPYTKPVHSVYIEKGNPLYNIIQSESMMVNSYHHQGIKRLSEKLLPVATAEDGLVEAVVMPDKKFVLAVQWHPEFSYHVDEFSFRIFQEFVGICKGGLTDNQ
ncbi:gamma-glutamyl-gamma-aminobutyrate hydrolase family protein [Mesobacillus maritimus]|uniref:gamma-glutamyl-gamma-aminobutyrate hydrolase family protein n=1 Tax=Mesobacillus maritimus TaxID=1643336 RepID=UPI00203FF06A|nr:gamma-glutamyl-gamma-aminobutyrate hydrolase family protein [Mesobacillus maritimus]MCM3584774.1 gamma-glutamyl-gamma-aminobutyrate hydrolase family protein [Mesobacillus maritimus]MCM3671860.1 gamma-glutamyl-gamma-aminobutyrate hydrolase family protein [Mesobacillus maritimus]